MYHPGKYSHHNKALEKFCIVFNKAAEGLGNLMLMKPSEEENFREDGEIIFNPAANKILYDFEKRFTYYDTYKGFKFDTFGQFERKIAKPEIALSIQCSRDETGFIIAWHEDYKKETIQHINSKTATGWERTGKRFTKDFKEFSYTEMNLFYNLLKYAFENNAFNASGFSV